MESILNSVKKLCNISPEDDSFDADILIHINSAFAFLKQIGVGPSEGFSVFDSDIEWEDFIPSSSELDMCKSYIFLKTKLIFDPPQQATVIELMKEEVKEFEWRLREQVENQNGGDY